MQTAKHSGLRTCICRCICTCSPARAASLLVSRACAHNSLQQAHLDIGVIIKLELVLGLCELQALDGTCLDASHLLFHLHVQA